MRFRHKLSIVLIGLTLVPLVSAGFLVLRLLEHDKVAHVDNGLATAVTAGGQAYAAQANQANAVAAQVAAQLPVQAEVRGDGRLSDDHLAAIVAKLVPSGAPPPLAAVGTSRLRCWADRNGLAQLTENDPAKMPPAAIW